MCIDKICGKYLEVHAKKDIAQKFKIFSEKAKLSRMKLFIVI